MLKLSELLEFEINLYKSGSAKPVARMTMEQLFQLILDVHKEIEEIPITSEPK